MDLKKVLKCKIVALFILDAPKSEAPKRINQSIQHKQDNFL